MPGPSTPSTSNVPPPTPPTPTPTSKRRVSSSSLSRRASGSNSLGQRKKLRSFVDDYLSTSDNETVREDKAEEDEVSEMVVDEDVRYQPYKPSERLRKVRANKEEARRKRREANKAWQEKHGRAFDDNEDVMSWTESPLPEESQSSPIQPEPGSSPFAKRTGTFNSYRRLVPQVFVPLILEGGLACLLRWYSRIPLHEQDDVLLVQCWEGMQVPSKVGCDKCLMHPPA